MTNLEKMIQHAAQKYYQDGTSELSDQQFDEMVDADIIRKLESLPSLKKADYIRQQIRKYIKKASR